MESLKLCGYGCRQEAKFYFKYVKKWCCSSHQNKCPKVKENSLKGKLKSKSKIFKNINHDLCDYSCGQEAKYQLKNEKKCCSKHINQCPKMKNVISLSNIGKHDHVGKNNPMYGKYHKESSKRKNSNSRKGKCSGKLHPNFGKNFDFIGVKNPNWKGGISFDPYPLTFNESLKKEIKERDSYTCQNPICYRTSKKLMVHHIDYDKDNCSNLNLIIICNSCNSRANGNREYWKTFYQEVVRR